MPSRVDRQAPPGDGCGTVEAAVEKLPDERSFIVRLIHANQESSRTSNNLTHTSRDHLTYEELVRRWLTTTTADGLRGDASAFLRSLERNETGDFYVLIGPDTMTRDLLRNAVAYDAVWRKQSSSVLITPDFDSALETSQSWETCLKSVDWLWSTKHLVIQPTTNVSWQSPIDVEDLVFLSSSSMHRLLSDMESRIQVAALVGAARVFLVDKLDTYSATGLSLVSASVKRLRHECERCGANPSWVLVGSEFSNVSEVASSILGHPITARSVFDISGPDSLNGVSYCLVRSEGEEFGKEWTVRYKLTRELASQLDGPVQVMELDPLVSLEDQAELLGIGRGRSMEMPGSSTARIHSVRRRRSVWPAAGSTTRVLISASPLDPARALGTQAARGANVVYPRPGPLDRDDYWLDPSSHLKREIWPYCPNPPESNASLLNSVVGAEEEARQAVRRGREVFDSGGLPRTGEEWKPIRIALREDPDIALDWVPRWELADRAAPGMTLMIRGQRHRVLALRPDHVEVASEADRVATARLRRLDVSVPTVAAGGRGEIRVGSGAPLHTYLGRVVIRDTSIGSHEYDPLAPGETISTRAEPEASERVVELETEAFILRLGRSNLRASPAASHAAVHLLRALVLDLVICEPWELGCAFFARDPVSDTNGSSSIMIYDAAPGGLGLARAIDARWPALVALAYEVLQSCSCSDGCFACVLSPDCRHPRRNDSVSKREATRLLRILAEG